VSAPAFTPGPWEARTFAIYGGANMRDRIAHTGGGLPPPRVRESDANARLIAAAPELYEALEATLEFLGEIGAGPRKALREQVQAALAKARGETL
jgi:hypothetical protein